MKKSSFTILFFLLIFQNILAQKEPMKYGKVEKADLEMTVVIRRRRRLAGRAEHIWIGAQRVFHKINHAVAVGVGGRAGNV